MKFQKFLAGALSAVLAVMSFTVTIGAASIGDTGESRAILPRSEQRRFSKSPPSLSKKSSKSWTFSLSKKFSKSWTFLRE